MSWHAHCGPRRSETGKFRSHAQLGTEKSSGGQYRDWFYSFVTHQTGSGVRRTRYAVSICDPNKNRVEYLRDFSSIEQATVAAQHCIDHQLGSGLPQPHEGPMSRLTPISLTSPISCQGPDSLPTPNSFPTSVGTIPPLPGSDSISANGGRGSGKNASQEK